MTFRQAIALATTLGLALVAASAAPAGASGGGGCGEPVTDGRGTKIAIEVFCFTPTVLYARPGDTVTWTNLDSVPHNVGGANLAWGSFEQLRRDRSISYSFSEPGVYSYVCSLHPGMMGTVVVGDPGAGSAAGGDVTLASSPVRAERTDHARTPQTSAGVGLWLATATILVAMAGLLVGRSVRRRARS
jgi:plastocyanin